MVHTTSSEPKDSGSTKSVDTLKVEQAGSTAKSASGSIGVAGALFVWFLFMQDHASDYITVFISTAACALGLAVIVGVYLVYCHRESKQHHHVRADPNLSGYGTNDSKGKIEVDPFVVGPVKVSPPDYMMHGHSWNSDDPPPIKSLQNGSIVRTFNPKDVGSRDLNGHSRYC